MAKAPAVSQKSADRTRNRIIKAAEKLFAEKGFRAMTLRDVTRLAKVNLAAVNYHFGSKTDLVRAVIWQRFEPINRERMEQLKSLIESHAPKPVPVEATLDALIRPLFKCMNQSGKPDTTLMQLIGRAITEPAEFIGPLHKDFFGELCCRFTDELRRSCPDMTEDELQCRFYLVVSTMLGSLIEQVRLNNLTDGKLDADQFDRMADELIHFVVAGFIA
ncbi:TetR/AcrR family transcriptional regulator [Coraliomargarita parva]|uniref:TetR/AcrR family transcriptional regulator n=1 Tax=Coraliomargarita parva TaxID=3014050 RepID=UPI0022B3589B|nr:TetR/AcrR family transcriptional regulator [Coraliomargarita parva]